MSVSQKQLLAAVALSLGAAGAVQAQSTLNAYGILDLSIGSFQLAGLDNSTDNNSTTKVESGLLTTSFIGFKGTEDLGGGLKAFFTLESFMRMDTGQSGRIPAQKDDVFWARAANVGLTGSFGKVMIGRMDNFLYQQALAFNPFGGSFGFSPTVRLTYGRWGVDKGDSGWGNSVAYYTPNLAGFTAAVQVQPGESDAEGTSTGFMAGYANGPFAIGFGFQTVKSAEAPKADVLSGKQTFGLLGASYDFGAAKVFAQFTKIDDNTNNDKDTIYQIGVSAPVTEKLVAMASYGSLKNKDDGAADSTSDRVLTVGVDYILSKRTDVYAAFMNNQQTNKTSGQTFAAGIKHAF